MIIQILQLVETPEAVAAYRKIHDEIWPEIKQGILQVGVKRMDLYLSGYTVVMVVEMQPGVDFDKAMAELANYPRQAEWEEFVGRYQQCAPGDSSAEKWKRMTKIFEL